MADSEYVVEVTAENYAEIIVEGSRSVPVLVDFWAEWCQPCKMLMPTLAKLAEEYQGKFLLAKINTEEQQELASQFGIRSIPTVKLFRDGQPVDEFMGALPEAEIRTFLDPHVTHESDNLVVQANELIQQGDTDAAVALMEEARRSDPGNPRTLIAYARLQAALGAVDQAEAALKELPPEEQDNQEVAGLRAQLRFDNIARSAPEPAELATSLEADPGNSEARYQLAAHEVMNGRYEEALEQLLTLLRKDRNYGDDAARKGMLAIFDILEGSGELVNRFRSRMFNALH
jgi:putative thioredoxin